MQSVESEIAIVLFSDVVAYSLLSLESQAYVASAFKQIAREAATEFACPLTLDAGDGVALIFFGNPMEAMSCAVRIAEKVSESGIEVRIGLHCGPLTRTLDFNGMPNAVGPAINLAERVMSCCDAGHILLSGSAAEMISPLREWAPFLQDLGEHEVKHGIRIRLVNLVTPTSGRTDIPEKLRPKSSGVRRNNFTAPERPFVGRRRDLENLKQRLENGRERLITLTGPGGIGKSRLALQVAQASAPNYADGAWVVECDALQTGEDLIAQIANVLDIPLGPRPITSLCEALAERQILLVVDCFERMVAHAARLEDLLKHSKELQIIATSRTLLGLARESEFVVEPLSMKREGASTADALALFVEAARAVDPEFRITRRNRETLETIIASVEGIPLAIILAAGRLRHLSLTELCEQLGRRRLDILKRRVSGEDRHADIGRVVDDSFILLRDELKDLLISLSVFRGFHILDAEAVLSEVPNLLEGVSELRENSLLAAHVVDDQMRYRCLDVVAEYLERASDPVHLEPLRKRHAEQFARRAISVRELYEDGRWKEASAAVGAELGNYRRAIAYSVEFQDHALVRALSASLCRILMESGYRADFETLVTASQELASKDNDLPLLVETTGLLGGVHRRDRNFEEAERQWLKRAHYCRQTGEVDKEADTWLDLADMALVHGDPGKVDDYLNRFGALEPLLSKGLVLASGFVVRARSAVRRGRRDEAKARASRALELAGALPVRMHSFYIWSSLAEVYNDLGEAEMSEKLCREGIRESLLGRHFSYAGLLLFKLSVSFELQNRPREAADALAIAEMIPKAVSQTLRDQLRTLRAEFIRKHGLPLLRSCENSRSGLDWQSEALGLIESTTENAGRTIP